MNDLRRFSDAVWPVADEPHDPRALARLVAGVARRLEAVERGALGEFGLTPATFRLLDLLAREGAMAPSEAARRLEVRQPTVTGWLKALRDGGLLERDAVAEDGRRARLAVSTTGRERHDEAADLVRRRQARLLAVLDASEQADLLVTLRRVIAAPDASAAAASDRASPPGGAAPGRRSGPG